MDTKTLSTITTVAIENELVHVNIAYSPKFYYILQKNRKKIYTRFKTGFVTLIKS